MGLGPLLPSNVSADRGRRGRGRVPVDSGPSLDSMERRKVIPHMLAVAMTLLVPVVAAAWSLVAGHRLSLRAYPDPRTASRALMPMAALAFVLTVAGIMLLNQPMAMRHGM